MARAPTKRWAIAAAGVIAGALAILAILSLAGGSGGSALAEAGERMEGQSMRARFALNMPVPDEAHIQMDFVGEVISNADGSVARLNGTYTYDQDVPGEVPAEILMIRDDMWMRSETFASFMPPGKRWVHMVDDTTPSETLTPSEYSRFLSEADDVDAVDEDAQVDGKPTTHYRGVVDVQDIADEVGGETEERYERMFGGRSINVPLEAWIGRDGLPVRIKVEWDVAGKHLSMSADVREYGVPVDVKPPPAARTIEEAEFDRLTETG